MTLAGSDEDLRMNDVSDDDLIRMYGEGDTDAFHTLFDRYHASVYNFARSMLGNC
jgi:DNA-directed RNA polymerase specialized sigma24 family protein